MQKSKGVKIKEQAKVIPKKSRYYEEPKGKQTTQPSEKDEARLLRKLIKEILRERKEEPTRRSTRLRTPRSGFASSIKSNTLKEPIFIDEDEEDLLFLLLCKFIF